MSKGWILILYFSKNYFQSARMLFEKDNTDADFIRTNIQKFEVVFEML